MEAIGEQSRDEKAPKWIEWAALSTMAMALFSAAGGLLAGMTGNEALIERQEQIAELIRMNRMELEAEVRLTRLVVIKSAGETPEPSLLKDIEAANKKVSEYSKQASEDVADSKTALRTHELFAIGTTILSVAITLTGMAVIVWKKCI